MRHGKPGTCTSFVLLKILSVVTISVCATRIQNSKSTFDLVTRIVHGKSSDALNPFKIFPQINKFTKENPRLFTLLIFLILYPFIHTVKEIFTTHTI